GGVGLSGAGAAAAARGVLAAVVLAAGAGDRGDGARVVTTTADLATLLGAGWDRPDLPGLTVTATAEDAVAVLEHAAADRAPAIADHATVVGDTGGGPSHRFPPIVVLTSGPTTPATARRLSA